MKDRTSDHIHFPQHAHRIPRRSDGVSGYSDLLGRAVLISIINYLADVVDAIEDIKLPKQHKDRTKLKSDKKRMCDTAVRGANTLTALFNSAKGQTKYTDPARESNQIQPNPCNQRIHLTLSQQRTCRSTETKSGVSYCIPCQKPRHRSPALANLSRSHRGSKDSPPSCLVSRKKSAGGSGFNVRPRHMISAQQRIAIQARHMANAQPLASPMINTLHAQARLISDRRGPSSQRAILSEGRGAVHLHPLVDVLLCSWLHLIEKQ